jgi:predicted MFS family arabinose efflux permease
MYVNVPIALLAATLAFKFVHESKAEGDRSYDIPGVITATAGLFSLTYGFSHAATHGWSNSSTIVYFIAAVVFLFAFIQIEKRVANPLMPLRVVTDRNRGGSYLGSLVVGAGLFSMFLFLGIFFQVVLGFSPLRSGFAFLPFTAGIIFGAGISSNLLPKFGPKPLMIPGLLVSATGLILLTRLTPTSAYATHIVPSLLLMSFGLAFVFIPLTSTSLHAVSHHDTGVASAMVNTSQQIGGSLGTALLNTVSATAAASFAKSHVKMGQFDAMVHGFTRAWTVGAGLLVTGAIVLFFFINIGKEAVVETEGVAMH